jgi:precorrin isomerase
MPPSAIMLFVERMIHACGDATSGDHALVFERMIHACGDATSGDHALC